MSWMYIKTILVENQKFYNQNRHIMYLLYLYIYQMTTLPKILFISGSLRSASANRGLLRAAAKLVPAGSVDIIYPSIKLPFYDGDLETSKSNGRPDSVQILWDQFHAADAVLIATPEYNGSYPAILKNALDWMTRTSHGAHPLTDLPMAVISVAGGGGAEVQEALKKFTMRLKGTPIELPSPIQFRSAKFDLTDKSTLSALEGAVHAVVDAAKKHYIAKDHLIK
jgi:chromate reductase